MTDFQSGRTAVLRVSSIDLQRHWRADGTSYLVSTASAEKADGAFRVLQREYALRHMLDASWACVPFELSHAVDHAELWFGDPGGLTLRDLCGQHLPVGQVLSIGVAIATATAAMHAAGIVHRDLNPDNILLDADNQHAWLTGFGNAVTGPGASKQATVRDLTISSLSYLAPELSGLINRTVDARADLYSIGCMLYELLVGVRVFGDDDLRGVVHSHLASQPPDVRQLRRDTPEVLAQIVEKLLAKDANDRYANADGLAWDLEQCGIQWREQGSVDAFLLDHSNVAHRLNTATFLYGRDAETEQLKSMFDRVALQGGTEGVLILGESGSGKTALARSLPASLGDRPHRFAAGKCGVIEATVPYGCIATAMNALLSMSLRQAEDAFQEVAVRLRAALGANMSVLVPLLPELRFFAAQPIEPDREPGRELNRNTDRNSETVDKQRFLEIVRRFLACFASEGAPLIVFIDDLQWADGGTLSVIEYLLQSADPVDHLVLVGALRRAETDDGVSSAEHRYGFRTQMSLGALDLESVASFVSDTLACASTLALPLARLIRTKTQGNPFFTVRFFGALLQEGLVSFDRSTCIWRWDLERIRDRDITSNVVDFLLPRVETLSESGLRVLQHLACLGDRASVSTLSIALGMNEDEVREAFAAIEGAELVRWNGAEYVFWHDRIRETVYLTLHRGRGPSTLHARIGDRIVTHLAESMPRALLFLGANQVNLGMESIASPHDRERYGAINLQAGIEARQSADYLTALNFLGFAAQFLHDTDDAPTHHRIEFHTAECEFMTGRFQQAEQRLRDLAVAPIDERLKADVARVRTALYTTIGDIRTAIDVGLQFVNEAGIQFTTTPTDQDTDRICAHVVTLIDAFKRDGRQIGDARADEKWTGVMDVFADLIPPVLFSNNSNLGHCVALTIVSMTLEHGCCGSSSYGMVCAASGLVYRFMDARRGRIAAQMAHELIRTPGLDRLAARVLMCLGTIAMPWMSPIRESKQHLLDAAVRAYDDCDLTFAVYCQRNMVSHLLFAGVSLDELDQTAERALAYVNQAGFRMVFGAVLAQVMLISTLRGTYESTLSSLGLTATWADEFVSGPLATSTGAYAYWVHRLQIAVMFRQWSDALKFEARAADIVSASIGHVEAADLPLYGGLARAWAYSNESDSALRDEHRAALRAYGSQLCRFADNCPANFGDRAALVRAEIARVEGLVLEAQALYEEAIACARSQGFVHMEALANEAAAGFYESLHLKTTAESFLRSARSAYRHYGADAKVDDIERRLPRIVDSVAAAFVSPQLEQQLDTQAIITASHALSSEMLLPRLLDVLMKNVLEHAGATHGVVTLLVDGVLHIEAEARMVGMSVEVAVATRELSSVDMPTGLLLAVSRTRQSILLDHAAESGSFRDDPVVARQRLRSVLCLPLLKQSALIGVLYVENNQIVGAFTPEKTRLLEVLASQAAISLENARLYAQTIESNARREAAEEALRNSREALARISRLTTMGQMVASIAHEVSQPLVSIATGAGAAMRWLHRPEPNLNEVNDALERIQLDSTRARDIVRGLRALAKRSALNFTEFDLNDAVREVLLVVRSEIEKRAVSIDAEALNGPCVAWGDRVQIQQVVLNLTMNAVEAMSEVAGRERRLTLSTQRGEGATWLAVVDTGPGIAPHTRDKMFAPFVTTKEGGMGMGLSICASIVEGHKGRLNVAQSPSGGARFEVVLFDSALSPRRS